MQVEGLTGELVRLADEVPSAVECLVTLFRGDRGLAEGLLGRRSVADLRGATGKEWAEYLGVGLGMGGRVAAAVALGRVGVDSGNGERPAMESARLVYELLRGHLVGVEQEIFVALMLDGRRRLRWVVRVSVGTLTTSLVHPREVFRPAIRNAAAGVIVAHNHPSGDPEPSEQDLAVTRRLHRVGELVGIPLVDHVILGARTFVSLRERLDLG